MTRSDFVDKSIQLYKRYNHYQLFYMQGSYYDKLVSADPYYISEKTLQSLERAGPTLAAWLDAQSEFYKHIEEPQYGWFKELILPNLGKDVLHYQSIIARRPNQTRITRYDLSSFPLNSHEAQLRWGAVGHVHFLTIAFNEVVPLEKGTARIGLPHFNVAVQSIVDKLCRQDEDLCLYVSPDKYVVETTRFVETLSQTQILRARTLNSENFFFRKGQLIHRDTGKTVRLIFRREMSLETLLKDDFGRKVVECYLDGELHFEPDLHLQNDNKLGMALCFDPRSRDHFTDDMRSLFLRTSFLDRGLVSFNSVFSGNHDSLDDFISRSPASKRNYVIKFGGSDLRLSFGGGQVYKLNGSRPHLRKVLKKAFGYTPHEWIIQDLDSTRYSVRYLKGDYEDPASCKVGYSHNAPARFRIYYLYEGGESRIVSASANFVNDEWKARLKISRHSEGKGAILVPMRLGNSSLG